MTGGDGVYQSSAGFGTTGERCDFAEVIGSHFDNGILVCRIQTEQILRHSDLIVGVSNGVKDSFGRCRFGENGTEHLFNAGFADAAGYSGDLQTGKTAAVKVCDLLIGR